MIEVTACRTVQEARELIELLGSRVVDVQQYGSDIVVFYWGD